MRWRLGFVITLVLSLLPAIAWADPSDPSAAEALFRAGRKAFEAGDYASALVRFQEAYRLDPTAGTLLNQAICEEKLGRLAHAWQSYRKVVEMLPASDERIRMTVSSIRALEQRLSWVTITLAPRAPKKTRIHRGSVELTEASLGVALPFDPGRHELVVDAPGYSSQRYVLELREGERQTLVVSPGAGSTVAPPAPKKSPSPPPPKPKSPGQPGSPTLGYALLGVGAVAAVTSTVTGILLIDRLNEVDEHCENKRCDPQGLEAGESGRTLRAIFGVSVAVGVVSLGAGSYFLFSHGPSASEVAWRGSF
jgi:hypothetical protein